MVSTLCPTQTARQGSSHFHLDHSDRGRGAQSTRKVKHINAPSENPALREPQGPEGRPRDSRSDWGGAGGSHRRCPGSGAMPGFLLWTRGLRVPLQHPLPLTVWKGEITGPQAGGQDKGPPVAPLTGTPGTGLQPWGKAGRGGSWEAGLRQALLGGRREGGREGLAPPGGGRSPGRSVQEGGWGRTTGHWGPTTEPVISRPVPHPHCALGGWRHGGLLTSWDLGVRGPHPPGRSLGPPPSAIGTLQVLSLHLRAREGAPLLLHFLSSPWIIFKRLGFLFSLSGGLAPSIRPSSRPFGQRPGRRGLARCRPPGSVVTRD